MGALVGEPQPGDADAAGGGEGAGDGGKGVGSGDRVVAESLDAQQATVGGVADLPQCGQIGQSFPDPEIAGVVDGGFGAQGLSFRRVGPAGCPADPPSEPYVPLVAAYGSSKPRGRAG